MGKEINFIKLDNVSKSFGSNKVLDSINIQSNKNSITGLIGPSGAGKTTIINLITGILRPSEGTVRVLGEKLVDSSQNSKKIGVLYDDLGLFDRLTVFENLNIYCKIYGLSKDNLDEALTIVGLEKAKKKKVMDLSKGMKQRLALARTFLNRPELIVLDEPTSGLDPRNANRIHKILLEFKNRGTTIFLSTHNMEEATKLCDSVYIIHNGRIVEKGSVEELCSKYDEKNSISIIKRNEEHILLNKLEDKKELLQIISEDDYISIHSTEPNLESVFLTITGENFYE